MLQLIENVCHGCATHAVDKEVWDTKSDLVLHGSGFGVILCPFLKEDVRGCGDC